LLARTSSHSHCAPSPRDQIARASSITRAKVIYDRYGFRAVGLRRGYYPEGGVGLLGGSAREDAIVMSFKL
jgi:ribosomal protein S18 acetylase RimI-like enzyme